MKTYIALFRGINVGGNQKLPMKELEQVLAQNGCVDVRTYAIVRGPWLRPGTEYRALGAPEDEDQAAPDRFVVPDYAASRRPGSQPLGRRRLTGVRIAVRQAGMTPSSSPLMTDRRPGRSTCVRCCR